jgi:hypothetical protein
MLKKMEGAQSEETTDILTVDYESLIYLYDTSEAGKE